MSRETLILDMKDKRRTWKWLGASGVILSIVHGTVATINYEHGRYGHLWVNIPSLIVSLACLGCALYWHHRLTQSIRSLGGVR